MKLIPSTIAVITACFVATSAFGQAPEDNPGGKKGGRNPEAVLQKNDTNKDGKISLEEWKANKKDPAKAEARFKMLDADKDGSVTLEELKAAKPAGKDGKKGKAGKRGAKPSDGEAAVKTEA